MRRSWAHHPPCLERIFCASILARIFYCIAGKRMMLHWADMGGTSIEGTGLEHSSASATERLSSNAFSHTDYLNYRLGQ
jgi:hypothetical protein